MSTQFLDGPEVTGNPNGTISRANVNRNVAVKVAADTAAAQKDAIPVALSTAHGTNNVDEIIAELLNYTSDNAVTIKTRGMLYLQATAPYAVAMNGRGVLSSTVAGQVEAAPALTNTGGQLGFGRIVGGFSKEIDGATVNIYKVFVN